MFIDVYVWIDRRICAFLIYASAYQIFFRVYDRSTYGGALEVSCNMTFRKEAIFENNVIGNPSFLSGGRGGKQWCLWVLLSYCSFTSTVTGGCIYEG